MPPTEDSLFDAPPPVAEAGVDQPAAEAAAPALTTEAVEAMLAPLQQQLTDTGRELAASQEAYRSLEARANAQPAATPTPEPTPDDFIESFTNDAQGTIDKAVEKGVQAQLAKLAPLLEQQNNTTHENLVSAHEREIDAKFGAGTWKEEFAPVFDQSMADLRRSNPQALSNPGTVRNEVLSITGLKMDALSERRSTLATTNQATKDAAETAMFEKFNLTGLAGGQRAAAPSTSRELSDGEKDYLASKRLDGQTANIQELRESASRDGTLDSWRAGQKGATT